MNFLKTSILSGISTIVKMTSGLVISKIIAVYIGPAGVALIGQFQNFLGMITTIGNGAINAGVTKYVAEYNETDVQKRNDVINAAFLITLTFSLLTGSIVFFGSSYFSDWIFNTADYSSVFKLLGISLVFIGFNAVILSVINGLKEIKLFVAINISSSLFLLLFTSLLTIYYKILGALLAMVIVQSLVLCISLPIALKKIDIKFKFNVGFEKIYVRKLLAFSLMIIIAVVSDSVTQILIRNHLITTFSMDIAGYWQSVWMISNMYLMTLTTAFSTYYLPKLSELQTPVELRKEIASGYKIIIPFVVITALGIYFLRDVIIFILFTPEFHEMRTLFLFQLIGDFFKMASWTLSFLMLAKAMTRTFIITEIVFSVSFYLLTLFFTARFSVEGVTHAYALNHFIYLITMVLLFRHIIFIKKRKLESIVDQPLVTIFTPVYNHEKYLEDYFKSIIGQMYQNIELIIIDDASHDQSTAIIEKWLPELKQRFVKLTYIERVENKGLIQGCNEGLELSDGKYFYMFSSDDVMLPENISEKVSYLEENADCGMVYSDGYYIYEKRLELFLLLKRILRRKLSHTHQPRWGNIKKEIIEKNFIFAPTVCVRKSVFETVGNYSTKYAFEDYYLWVRIAKAYEVGYIAKPLIKYRIHENSLSHSKEHTETLNESLLLLIKEFENDPDYPDESIKMAYDNYHKIKAKQSYYLNDYEKFNYYSSLTKRDLDLAMKKRLLLMKRWRKRK